MRFPQISKSGEKEMYKSAGYKLRGVVSTITTIMMIGSVVEGIAIWVTVMNIDDELGTVGFIIGLTVAAIGCITWWLVNLAIATFAEMAINVNQIAECKKESGEINEATAEYKTNENWTCASCRTANAISFDKCQNCGVTKRWSDWKNTQ